MGQVMLVERVMFNKYRGPDKCGASRYQYANLVEI